eukprot:6478984-Lingulodinium_polyedra.AAC.1
MPLSTRRRCSTCRWASSLPSGASAATCSACALWWSRAAQTRASKAGCSCPRSCRRTPSWPPPP